MAIHHLPSKALKDREARDSGTEGLLDLRSVPPIVRGQLAHILADTVAAIDRLTQFTNRTSRISEQIESAFCREHGLAHFPGVQASTAVYRIPEFPEKGAGSESA